MNTLQMRSVVFCVIFLLLNCNPKKTYKIEYKDNVKEIMNYKPLYGEKEIYSLELHRVFGGPDDKDSILGQPADVVKDSEGNIFIFDKSDLNIKKYDKDGNLVMTFGRSGKGPGEYLYFQSMQIDREDNLYIHEIMSGRLQKITNEGKYVDEYKLPIYALWFLILDNEKIVFSESYDLGKEKKAILHVSNYNDDIIYSFCKPQIKEDERMTRAFNFIGSLQH